MNWIKCTESIRRVGEWSSMDLVKRNTVIVDLPEASNDGIWRSERTNSNGDADFFHFVFCCWNFGAGSATTTLFYFVEFEFLRDWRNCPWRNGYFLYIMDFLSAVGLLNHTFQNFNSYPLIYTHTHQTSDIHKWTYIWCIWFII